MQPAGFGSRAGVRSHAASRAGSFSGKSSRNAAMFSTGIVENEFSGVWRFLRCLARTTKFAVLGFFRIWPLVFLVENVV